MPTSSRSATPEAVIRNMQVLATALPLGVVVFALAATLMLGALDQPPTGSIVSLVGVGLAAVTLVVQAFVPRAVATRMISVDLPVSDEMRPYTACLSQMVVRMALLEAAAFFNICCLIIEHNWWSLAMAGLMVGWMLANFPTAARVHECAAQLRLEQEAGTKE